MGNQHNGRSLFWHRFAYEVYKATASLMYLLEGIQTIRENEPNHNLRAGVTDPRSASSSPMLPGVDIPLVMTGHVDRLNQLLGPGGEVEQLAFLGWVEQVYNQVWESRKRNEMIAGLQGPDVMSPQSDPIGDFGHIRNDLVHHHGIARVEETGKCVVLKWFEPGEHMVLEMRHVFDFLNQIGLMTNIAGFIEDGTAYSWSAFPHMQQALLDRPVPALVSVRTSTVKQDEDGTSFHGVHVVFENGVFGNVLVEWPPDSRPVRGRITYFQTAQVDSNGDLRFEDGKVMRRDQLYRSSVDTTVGKHLEIDDMPVPGPWFRFKK